jgi:hypothetical protein
MPLSLLKDLSTKNYDDDANESPIDFDSNLEFWSMQYEKHIDELDKSIKTGDNVNVTSWHRQTTEKPVNPKIDKDPINSLNNMIDQ